MSFQKIDWKNVRALVLERKSLMPVMKSIPREQWNQEPDSFGQYLIHWSCLGGSNDALVEIIKNNKEDINLMENGRNRNNWTPIHQAILCEDISVCEILCASGANLKRQSGRGNTPFRLSLFCNDYKCAKFLIANGLRCRYEFEPYEFARKSHQPLLEFEEGVLRCRNVIVTLLGIKKRRSFSACRVLSKLDRFLLKEVLAVEIWATRSCENTKWQK